MAQSQIAVIAVSAIGVMIVVIIVMGIIKGKKNREWLAAHPEAAFVYVETPSGGLANIQKVNGQKNAAYGFRDAYGYGFGFLPGTVTLHFIYKRTALTPLGKKYITLDDDITVYAPAGSRQVLVFNEEARTVTVRPL